MKLKHYHKTMHLKEHQLMPKNSACPFCLLENSIPVGVLQENPKITLQSCQVCQAVFASRIPTAKTLKQFYCEYYDNNSYYGQEKRITFDLSKKFANHIAKKCIPLIKKRCIHLIDFGGGDGSLSIQLAKTFLEKSYKKIYIMIVDYNESLSSINDDRIVIDRRTNLNEITDRQYDLIIASAIIEHLPQPRDALISLLNLLNTNGIIYIRTPYIMPFFKLSKALGLQWDFHYPSHLHDLGPSFWNSIFRNLKINDSFVTIALKPSIVETSFNKHFFRTFFAYILKLPWYLVGDYYKMIGGYEIFVMKK